jgi:RimJ/RimL family protein N-acetyltransferase
MLKSFPLGDEDILTLAEIETHPKVVEWDVDIHTTNINEMYRLFKEFFEKLPNNKDQIFLVGRFDNKVIGFLGIHRKGKRMQHVGVVGITIHPDYWGRDFGTELLRAGVEFTRKEGFFEA